MYDLKALLKVVKYFVHSKKKKKKIFRSEEKRKTTRTINYWFWVEMVIHNDLQSGTLSIAKKTKNKLKKH